ncbi:transcriptional regulator containing an amidase domain and an AraC-type DNA-binding HTH domain [Mesorhizobium australicum WSM2073]|uniref:Transcriptional regulator containing an amidase domain and an AraC-type DNA-binding HTH domain n=1 Tax=Mesorhizobium australicum (strain HAMBI 3006 / LMG 24608 / WSM2073) TaxID=754035 RepID=L0KLN8_MESAW|nr:transcriptional regulator containing an amidase domain and an AraC-type DNA-binding HTH domain [Mesorhizobium australicum WSM2073]
MAPSLDKRQIGPIRCGFREDACAGKAGCSLKKNVFSSLDLPSHLDDRARFALWQDIHVAEIWSVEYAISGNVPFQADIEATAIGPLVLGRMAGTIKHASRKTRNIADDGRDGYLLLVNDGDTRLSGVQTGRDYSIGRGEGALVSASEALEMTGGDRNVWTNVVVPREIMENAFAHVEDRLALTIGVDNEALDMLKRYCGFLEAGPALLLPDLVAHATETIVDLIGLATGAKGEIAELAGVRGLRAARLQAILQTMRDNFADPGISAQHIAQRLRLSARYVHDLLQETGSSFAEHILELRLQRAHRMLRDRRNDRMRVSEIALLSGFSDVSYFNRCFRRRFGSTPNAAR